MRSTKIINGVKFEIVGYESKKEVNDIAMRIRKDGYNARVFYNKKGKFYTVYQSTIKRMR